MPGKVKEEMLSRWASQNGSPRAMVSSYFCIGKEAMTALVAEVTNEVYYARTEQGSWKDCRPITV